MLKFTDQLGNTITMKERPKRVISIVPSQSEFLWDIGVCKELVGITKFCIHPEALFKSVDRVGGTKQLNLKKIRQLKPDLIIGNKEENEQGQIKELQKEFNVWMSDIYNFEDAFDMMEKLGDVFRKKKKSKQIISKLKKDLPEIKNRFNKHTVAYFIWNKPYMLAANDTFIHHVLEYIGFQNSAKKISRYPEIEINELKKMNPEFCFLSSEPFPFKEKHLQGLQTILPKSKIFIVDGEAFSWYGSRLLGLKDYVMELNNLVNS